MNHPPGWSLSGRRRLLPRRDVPLRPRRLDDDERDVFPPVGVGLSATGSTGFDGFDSGSVTGFASDDGSLLRLRPSLRLLPPLRLFPLLRLPPPLRLLRPPRLPVFWSDRLPPSRRLPSPRLPSPRLPRPPRCRLLSSPRCDTFGAFLSGAFFPGVFSSGAFLTCTFLSGAFLCCAFLSGAFFPGVD